jgi:signal transduction histidine kinase
MAIGIRKKIGISFFIFMLASTLIWFLNYYKHELIYEKLQIIEKKDYLFNKILEARRYEKNYFLFENPDDLRQSIGYVMEAQDWLMAIIQAHGQYTLERDLESRYRELDEYRLALMAALGDTLQDPTLESAVEAVPDVEAHQEKIRTLGKEITDDLERIVSSERRLVVQLLQESTYYLYFALAAIFILTALTALFIFFNINRPLKNIENAIHKIALGDTKDIPPVDTGDVFGPLVSSLNDMIHKLNQRNRQIVQTEKLASLGTLTSGVAHELNNPLNNISTSVQILLEELEEDDLAFKREMLEATEVQIDRAKDIVRALLEFSRKGDFNPRPMDFLGLVKKTLTLLKGDLPANVSLQVEVPEEIRANLDAQRIQQVLINLIQNAIQAMEAGGVVRITADQPEGPETFRFQVSDSGKGIAKTNLKKIFDPFFTTKDVSSGSGLGLSITHGIVEQHHGRIMVESPPNEGTTFSVYLPTGIELENGGT